MEEKTTKPTVTQVVKEIRRNTRLKFSAEEKIKIVLEVLRGEANTLQISRGAMMPYCVTLFNQS